MSTNLHDQILLCHVLAKHLERVASSLALETRTATNPLGDDLADADRLIRAAHHHLRSAHRLCQSDPACRSDLTPVGLLRATAIAAALEADDALPILAAGLRGKNVPGTSAWDPERRAVQAATAASSLAELEPLADDLANLYEVNRW